MKKKCLICGYVYDPELGDPAGGIAPGTPFSDLPDDWACPVCGAAKTDFVDVEEEETLIPTAGGKKMVLFAFQGNPMCFIHVLLNALYLAQRGREGKIVIEGEAVKLVAEMSKTDHFLNPLYQKTKEKGLIIGVCKACSAKLGATEAVEAENLPLLDDMSGHPSMGDFLEKGYQIITF